MRIRAAIATALLAVTVACQATPATAAARHHENVLRGWCAVSGVPGAKLRSECVVNADDDHRRFTVITRGGHRVTPRTERAALRLLRHHALPCKQEDSNRCFWDAGTAGNGTGSSFIVIGNARGAWYLQDITRG